MTLEMQDPQQVILNLIRAKKPENQTALQALLKNKGVEMTQSSISRFLNRAGIKKVDGQYKIPEIVVGESSQLEFLKILQAGENMLVLKTPIGSASRAGYIIDSSNIPGIAGTISGDDTLFVALLDGTYLGPVKAKIVELFR